MPTTLSQRLGTGNKILKVLTKNKKEFIHLQRYAFIFDMQRVLYFFNKIILIKH